MWRNRNRLYILLLLLCLFGYIWLFLNLVPLSGAHYLGFNGSSIPVFCFFKSLTGHPCPSCGVTRSVVELFRGNLLAAIYMNPLGLVVFLIITTVPFWIIIDLLTKKSSFWFFYKRAERWFLQKKIAIPFAVLIILNWIWNFVKGY